MNAQLFFCLLLIALAFGALYWSQLGNRENRNKILPLGILAAISCAVFYLLVGDPFVSEEISQYRDKKASWQTEATQLEAQIKREAVTAQQVAALRKLSFIYKQLQEYSKAEDAARRAVLASEGEPQVILEYGKAQVLNAGGQVTAGAKKAFTLSAALMPENPEPLLLLAVAKGQEGYISQAREAMETLAQAFPNDVWLQRAIAEELAKLPKR